MATTNNRTSVLISSQVPQFVRDQHEMFVTFLEHYYKFLEQDGNQTYLIKNFTRYLDIDIIGEDVINDINEGLYTNIRDEGRYSIFLQKLYDSYIKLLPDSVIADKNILVKHAKDFYRARGAENSVKFLIRALFNKESTLYYPKTDVIKASDGKWFIEQALRITDIEVGLVDANGDVEVFESDATAIMKFKNHTVRGNTTNASATVENAVTFYENGILIKELKLSGSVGDFNNGEYVFADYEEEGVIKRVRANLFSGIVNSVEIISSGIGYSEGDIVPVISNTGSGAVIEVTKVTKSGILSIGVTKQGAGFRVDDAILVTGGGGAGANGKILVVDQSGNTHPNSYNIIGTTIASLANDVIGNGTVQFGNLSSANANTTLANALQFWTFANTGPILACITTSPGEGYSTVPLLDARSNTIIKSLGILGSMQIVDGGVNYAVNDSIIFENQIGTFGSGGLARVAAVNANGSITKVQFVSANGEIVGGTGYSQSFLPRANVQSVYGSNANVVVTAILGDGEELFTRTDVAGAIEELRIISGGSGYLEPPLLDFESIGTGTGAIAIASIVTGVYDYPGRYINDDGQVSSFNFIQDRDYYQNYSYVIRTNESLNKYRKPMMDLIHPTGSKMFGEYQIGVQDPEDTSINVAGDLIKSTLIKANYIVNDYDNAFYNVNIINANVVPYIFNAGYSANTSNIYARFIASNDTITILNNDRNYLPGDNVYFAFIDYNVYEPNVISQIYTIESANANQVTIQISAGNTANNYGNCGIYSPVMTFTAYGHGRLRDDRIYIKFNSSNTALGNGFYNVRRTGAFTFSIDHPNVASLNSNTGYANIFTNTVTLFADSHGFTKNQRTYLRFRTGDTANTPNAYYNIPVAPGANSFNIRTSNVVMTNGTAYLHTNKLTLNVANFYQNNSANVYVQFVSGDIANSNSGIYMVHDFANGVNTVSNTFVINVNVPLTTNGNVRLYKTNTYYNVATVSLTNHGFSTGNTVFVEFESDNLISSIYNVQNVVDANTFNISNIEFTIYQYVASGNVSVGLHK